MKKKILLTAALVVALTIAAFAVFAQGAGNARQGKARMGQRDPGQMFERMDANKDGKLTKEEVPEQAWERIVKADADNNGAVTKEEMAKVVKARAGNGQGNAKMGGPGMGQRDPGQMFERMDANKDGKLTKEELPERVAEKMMNMDADGNGSISQDEFATGCKNRERDGTRGGKRNGGGQGTDI